MSEPSKQALELARDGRRYLEADEETTRLLALAIDAFAASAVTEEQRACADVPGGMSDYVHTEAERVALLRAAEAIRERIKAK